MIVASLEMSDEPKFGRTDIGYYVCGRKGCRFNSSTRKVHDAFEVLLNRYALSDKVANLLKRQLALTFEYMNKENRERVKGIKANLKQKEKDLEQAIAKGRRCGLTEQEIRSLFEILMRE